MDMEVLEQYGELDKIGTPEALEIKDEKPQPAAVSADGFYGNKPAQQPQEQQRSLPHHQSNPGTAAHPHLYPIESLSPYAHKWTIRARCTHKGDMKTWHNTKGEGKLFSVNLLDDTGEIRATAFNDAAERLYPTFQEGTVYYISAPCRVTLAKKQFSNLPNDYELQFERDTEVEKASLNALYPCYHNLCFLGRGPRQCTTNSIQLHEDWRPERYRERHYYRYHRYSQRGWRGQHNYI